MMTAAVWDHLLVAFLLAFVPVYGRISYRSLTRRLAAGDPGARRSEYLWTIAFEWGLLAVVLVGFGVIGSRPLAALGFDLPQGWRSIGGAIATLTGLALLVAQWRAISRVDATGLEGLREQLAGASALVPRTDAEHRIFRAVALTAGIVEEIVYRGYLIWYMTAFVGAWPAALAAAVAFGLGHFYQGPSGVVKTGVAGLVAGGLFVATGSILWPIVLHVAVDLHGGAVGRRALGTAPA